MKKMIMMMTMNVYLHNINYKKIKVIGNIYMIIKYKPTNKPITINRSTYKKIKEQIQNETDSIELQIENCMLHYKIQ